MTTTKDEKDDGAKSFATLLPQVDDGALHAEATEELRKLLATLGTMSDQPLDQPAHDLLEPGLVNVEHILQFFAYAHLPDVLKDVSRPFGQLAVSIVSTLPRNPERTVALRKLLEAKDAAVRALVAK